MKISDILLDDSMSLKKRNFTKNEIEIVRDAYVSGEPLKVIGSKLDPPRSNDTINYFIKNQPDFKELQKQRALNGGKSNIPRASDDIELIRKAYVSGESLKVIGSKFTPPRSSNNINSIIMYQPDYETLRQQRVLNGGRINMLYTSDEISFIRNAYVSGEPIKSIASKLNPPRSNDTINYFIKNQPDFKELQKQRALNGGRLNFSLTSEEAAFIRNAYVSGESLKVIGSKFTPPRSFSNISGFLINQSDFKELRKQRDLNGGRSNLPLSPNEIEFIKNEFVNGVPLSGIVSKLDYKRSHTSIHNILKKESDYQNLLDQHIENRERLWATSQEEIDFFKTLENVGVIFTDRNKRVSLSGRRYYNIDAIDDRAKVAVEFNGDLWHCNPNNPHYGDLPLDEPFSSKTGSLTPREIRDHDRKKREYLKSLGYTVIDVWSSDWAKPSQRPAIIDKIKHAVSSHRD